MLAVNYRKWHPIRRLSIHVSTRFNNRNYVQPHVSVCHRFIEDWCVWRLKNGLQVWSNILGKPA